MADFNFFGDPAGGRRIEPRQGFNDPFGGSRIGNPGQLDYRFNDPSTPGGGWIGGGAQNPFYSDFFKDLYTGFLNTDATAAFSSIFPWTNQVGNKAQFARSSLPRYMNMFTNALGNEPNLTYSDFFRRLNPEGEFSNLSPGERGEQQGRYAPPVRWKGIFGGR